MRGGQAPCVSWTDRTCVGGFIWSEREQRTPMRPLISSRSISRFHLFPKPPVRNKEGSAAVVQRDATHTRAYPGQDIIYCNSALDGPVPRAHLGTKMTFLSDWRQRFLYTLSPLCTKKPASRASPPHSLRLRARHGPQRSLRNY